MPCPEEFFSAYVRTALWSSNDESTPEGGEPFDANYDETDLTPEALAAMRADCDSFYDANTEVLNCEGVTYGPDFGQDGRAGHDFLADPQWPRCRLLGWRLAGTAGNHPYQHRARLWRMRPDPRRGWPYSPDVKR